MFALEARSTISDDDPPRVMSEDENFTIHRGYHPAFTLLAPKHDWGENIMYFLAMFPFWDDSGLSGSFWERKREKIFYSDSSPSFARQLYGVMDLSNADRQQNKDWNIGIS